MYEAISAERELDGQVTLVVPGRKAEVNNDGCSIRVAAKGRSTFVPKCLDLRSQEFSPYLWVNEVLDEVYFVGGRLCCALVTDRKIYRRSNAAKLITRSALPGSMDESCLMCGTDMPVREIRFECIEAR